MCFMHMNEGERIVDPSELAEEARRGDRARRRRECEYATAVPNL